VTAPRRAVLIGVVGTVLALVFLPVAAFGTLWTWTDACDGDGGAPYSARHSLEGRFCSSSVSTPYFLVELTLPVLVVVVATVVAARRGSFKQLVVGVVVAALLVVGMSMVITALPSYCSDEGTLDDPYNCGTY
jgi:hypothetical protein